jgi:uncharacterized protein YrrD
MTMETTLQFKQNAKVLTANGEEIGNITRVVIHPETKIVTHIVVRKKGLFDNEEKLLPIDQIDWTTEDQITLHETADEIDVLPLFEEKRKIREEGSGFNRGESVSQVPTAYGMPMVVPADRVPPEGRFITIVEQNIPSGTVAVKEGAKVITAEGKNVGKVEAVMADVPAEQATHLLVSKGLISEEKKLVPIDWVRWIEEKEIHLSVKKDTVMELDNVVLG